jgi:N-acetylmuramoyl-L-alanine amidase
MKNLKKGLFMLVVILAGISALTVLFWQNTHAAPRPRKTAISGSSELLARLIHAEAGAEPYTGQVAVGAVILNRIQNVKFPKTLAGVVYQPHAFESVSNGQINTTPTDSARKAARAALSGWDPSGGALFFYNPAKVTSPTSYIWTRRTIQKIGRHLFAL